MQTSSRSGSTPTVILLSGWRRSGKSTVAEYLVRQYGYTEISLAGPLKDLVAEKYGLPRYYLDNQEEKEKPIYEYPVADAGIEELLGKELYTDAKHDPQYYWTPRALCILEGRIARAVDPDYWTRQTIRSIVSSGASRVVVPDVRFRGEVELLRKYFPGAQLMRVLREVNCPSTDLSERDLDNYPWDQVLDNTGTREGLQLRIDRRLRDICGQ